MKIAVLGFTKDRLAYDLSAYLDVRQMLVEPESTGLLGSEVGVYLVSILDWHLLMHRI
jgi:hypothetical protein